MKNRINLNMVLFLIPLYVLFALNLMLSNEQTISQLEKRELKQSPAFSIEALFSGEYFREYEDYFADNFVFRSTFVAYNNKFKELFRFFNKDGVSIVVAGGNNMSAELAQENSEADSGHPPAIEDQDALPAMSQAAGLGDQDTAAKPKQEQSGDEELIGRYLTVGDKAMLLYQYTPEAAKKYAEALNRIQTQLNEKTKVYSLIVPSQIEFLQNEKYRSLSHSQKVAIEYLNQQLSDKITAVDAYGKLFANSNQYIYFRTDHHWTALGAYYAYSAFMEASKQKAVPVEQYKTTVFKNFLGSAYAATLSGKLAGNPDQLTFYEPNVDHDFYVVSNGEKVKRSIMDKSFAALDEKYGMFLGGDFSLGVIETEAEQDKKIAVIKDSYANALIPFLIAHYKEIHIIDPRYFEGDMKEYLISNEFDDVLFLNGTIVTTYYGISNLLITKMKLDQD